MKKVSRRKFIANSAKGAVAISATGLMASCSFLGNNTLIPRKKNRFQPGRTGEMIIY